MPSPIRRNHGALRAPRRLRAFLQLEAAGGLVLVTAAAVAFGWANSPFHESYERLWQTHVDLHVGGWSLEEDLRHWVNDGLMAVFFLVVGLELKRELVSGELRRWRSAAVPVLAALGGMVVPAVVYLAFNAQGPGARGWGVPMATDIAFALGILGLVGRRAHPALKVFILTLAVADDIGAIAVIAVVYTRSIDVVWLAAAVLLLLAIAVLNRLGLRTMGPFVLLGVGVWIATFQSGLHATIAGVALGLLTPAHPREPDEVVREWAKELLDEPMPDDLVQLRQLAKQGESPVERIETALHPWTSFVVVPVFALANSGVRLDGIDLDAQGTARVALGTAVALVLGKFLGVFGAAVLAVRLGVGALADGLTWRDLAGGAACAGIGFTVSLFVAGLAFDTPALTDAAKVGVLAGSLTAGGAAALILAGPRRR